jgi:hypothetical protein
MFSHRFHSATHDQGGDPPWQCRFRPPFILIFTTERGLKSLGAGSIPFHAFIIANYGYEISDVEGPHGVNALSPAALLVGDFLLRDAMYRV